MPELKKVLFALELADISVEVASWFDLVGRRFDCEAHVLHVVPSLEIYGLLYAMTPELIQDKEALMKRAEQKTAEFCEKHLKGLAPKVKVVMGSPAVEIVNYIRAEGISMAVLGTHGRSGLDRAILGSVADRVLRNSPVPVLCVTPKGKAQEA